MSTQETGTNFKDTDLEKCLTDLKKHVRRSSHGYSTEDVEDLTGTAVVNILERLAEKPPKTPVSIRSFRALIFTAANNLIVDAHRKKSRKPDTLSLDTYTAFPDTDDPVFLCEVVEDPLALTPEEAYISAETSQTVVSGVRAVFGELTKKEQDVLISRFIEGDKHEITAIKIGSTPGNSRVIEYRVTAKLQPLLEPLMDAN